MTHSALRQAVYRFINGRSSVFRLFRKCTICRKLRGPAQVQMMENLLEGRIIPAVPLTYSGMDVFGPSTIKRAEKNSSAGFNFYLSLSPGFTLFDLN